MHTVIKPIKETNKWNNNEIKRKNIGSSLVLRKHWVCGSVWVQKQVTNKVSSEDYKGKWHSSLFYPADFTFVCPTEIAAMNAKIWWVPRTWCWNFSSFYWYKIFS